MMNNSTSKIAAVSLTLSIIQWVIFFVIVMYLFLSLQSIATSGDDDHFLTWLWEVGVSGVFELVCSLIFGGIAAKKTKKTWTMSAVSLVTGGITFIALVIAIITMAHEKDLFIALAVIGIIACSAVAVAAITGLNLAGAYIMMFIDPSIQTKAHVRQSNMNNMNNIGNQNQGNRFGENL